MAKFRHNDLRFYVRAMMDVSEQNGRDPVDIRFMVPGFDRVQQATPQTIESELEAEDQHNADHMKTHWLHHDRAQMAVGMRESSGYEDAGGNGMSRVLGDRDKKKQAKNAYIGLARINAEHAKDHLNNIPLGFEVVANNPGTDKEAVASWNFYRDEILNHNNFEQVKKLFIGDGFDFGSGIIHNPYRERSTSADAMFLEERIRQGQPISIDEYEKHTEFIKTHVFEYIDTFSVLRDRRAKGEASMSFTNRAHTITTHMEHITVTEAMQEYPHLADRIQPNISDLYNEINPRSLHKHHDDLMITRKHTWIQFPVRYRLPVIVTDEFDEEVVKILDRNRTAVMRIVRLEGIGIADMLIDEYAHNQIPLTMWQRRPSKYHAYGIGAYKDMWSAEWAYNIAFNGKFRWFDRLAKGGGFFFKGVLGQEQINQRTKEHAWVSIDPNQLPADLRDRPIRDLVMDTPSQQLPTIYDNLEVNMEDKVNRTSGTRGLLGEPVGQSGRQQLLLKNQSEAGLGPTVSNLESPFLEMGEKLFSNMVQFDGDRMIRFNRTDPVSNEEQEVILNEPVAEVDDFDLMTGEFRLLASEIKNSLKNMDYRVRVSTRSLIPSNPTEQRFFWQDTLTAIQPMIQTPEGVLFLEELDKRVFGGILGDMLQRIQQMQQQRFDIQTQQAQQAQALQEQQAQQQNQFETIDRLQNKFRLEKKAESDLLKAIAAFKNGNEAPLDQFINDNSNIINGV